MFANYLPWKQRMGKLGPLLFLAAADVVTTRSIAVVLLFVMLNQTQDKTLHCHQVDLSYI